MRSFQYDERLDRILFLACARRARFIMYWALIHAQIEARPECHFFRPYNSRDTSTSGFYNTIYRHLEKVRSYAVEKIARTPPTVNRVNGCLYERTRYLQTRSARS